MKIERFVLGPVGTNCYIVRNEDTMECFIVDMAACPPELVSHIKNAGMTVRAVLLTHGHFDHIMGLDRFLEEFPVPVYACGAEKELLENAQMNSSAGMLGPYDRRMLLLHRRGKSTVQRRHALSGVSGTYRSAHGKHGRAGALC